MPNTSSALQRLCVALNLAAKATTDEERSAAEARLQVANEAFTKERIARVKKQIDADPKPNLPQSTLRTTAQERLAYLERAERGGGVNRSHCPPFAPMGKRLAREGLLTLVRAQTSVRCSHSTLALTDKGRMALTKLRKRLRVRGQAGMV